MLKPRGVRNNNPGNIRKSSDQWQGQVTGFDVAFVAFDTPENGFRAMAKILLNYYRVYRLRTLRDIITRWAPPSENDTRNYVAYVAGQTGINADFIMSEKFFMQQLPDIMQAMVKMEQGSFAKYYSLSQVTTGIVSATA